MRQITLLASAACTFAAPALANDSEAAVNLGGIELVANSSISMDSEDLYISKQEVRVRYRYTNRSAKDLELKISFPLPAIRAEDEELYGMQSIPDFTDLKFRTTVDGKPVKLTLVHRAEIKGIDVTQRVQQLGWPIDWIDGSGTEPSFLRSLTAKQKAAHAAEGLLRKTDNGDYRPNWDAATHVTRQQAFPAGRSVEVTHRYAPMIGGSVAGGLEPSLRAEYPEHLKKYCTDRAFLAAFDRRLAVQQNNPQAMTA